jgi:CopG family transcriptional regulator, nickel-responsive regulator
MQRVTITLDDDLMKDLDHCVAARGYQNRSEAVRDLVRAGIRQTMPESGGNGNCIAALVYVYDHHVRELAKRLTQAFHSHHVLSLASLHVHLDEENCMEVSVLKGPDKDVRHFGEHIVAERGVRHGRIITIPAPLPHKNR